MTSEYPRVAPVLSAERWDLPSKPEGALPAIADTFRQTQFQLGGDLRLLAEGMNLQLQVIKDSSPSRFRTLPLAVMAMYWSRAFLALGEAAQAAGRGAYAVCPALVRAACEAISAETQAGGEEHALFLGWLEGALVPNERHRATEIGLGNYFAGSTLASTERLGAAFRAATELSRQHFGATLLEVASESNRQRISATFADQSFHFGWAQLALGWLLSLCRVQLDLALADRSPFHAADETGTAVASFVARCEPALTAQGRCRIEEIEEHGTRRFLIHNFRRQSSGAPVKILL
ncbi:MAG TPA: hypothetical protein VK821_16210 [Dehalococcoidia bacterium]|nr:hypothetical protein [Dehalococcoidia bacterium]